jgi:hypothetical protein
LGIGFEGGDEAARCVKYLTGLIQIFKARRADILSLKRRAEVMFRLPRDADFAHVQEVIRDTLPAYLNMNRSNVDEVGAAQEELEEAQLVDEDDATQPFENEEDVNSELDSDMDMEEAEEEGEEDLEED